MRKEVNRDFTIDNPLYIIGRGKVFIDREELEMNDTIIDNNNGNKYLIVGIEKNIKLMSPPIVVPPYGYVLRQYSDLEDE